MTILYLISAVFAALVFIVFLFLNTLFDRWAKTRAGRYFHSGEVSGQPSWDKHFLRLIDAIKAPDIFDHLIRNEILIQSGIRLEVDQFKSLWWLLIVSGTSLGMFCMLSGGRGISGGVWGSIMILFLAGGPYLYLQWRIRERQRAVAKGLPDFLDMLTLTVEAGLGFISALQRVSRGHEGILGDEIRRVLVQIELGFSRREALEELVYRLPCSDVEHFVEAVNLSEQLGTSLARTLRVQANLMRTRRRQRAEVKAQTAPIRIIPALVFFFLPSLLLVYLAPPIINFLFQR